MKKLFIKSYSTTGAFIKVINDFKVGGFSKEINVGISNMTLTLARKFDTFNVDGDVELGNRLELYVTDEDTGTVPRKIYTGYIEQQIPRIDGNTEYVDILCLSVASYLTQDILKSGAQTKLYTKATVGLTTALADIAAAEIADILKAIITFFQTANANLHLYYSTSVGGVNTIETTGKTLFYTFEAMRYSDAIKKCQETAPQNWFWYIDENEIFNFKTPPASPTHTFLVGKDVSRIEVNKGLDSTKNIALVFASSVGGGTYKQYKDDTSIAQYGRRVKQINDNAIGDVTTMDNIGNSFVQENKDPRIRIVMDIVDNNESDQGYDIESIQPGETCQILGISPTSNLLTQNMIIQQVDWYDGRARVTIETRTDFDFDTFLLNLRKDIDQQSLDSIPESYT